MTRLPERNLDVLRAVAVLLVLVDHLLTIWDVYPQVVTRWELGRLGVLLFFVHTSLVLMSSLEREGGASGWVRAFYVRRAFRIYPLAITAVLIAVVTAMPSQVASRGAIGPAPAPGLGTVLANLALSQNLVGRHDVLAVLWSLPLEVQMYGVLPLCFIIARRGVGPVVAALGVAMVGGLCVRLSVIPGLWRLSVATFAPCFLGGVLAYALLRFPVRPRLPGWSWVLVLGGSVPLFTLLGPTPDLPERGWLFCVVVGCAIPLVANLPESVLTRGAKILCTYSYGIYLLHQPVLWFSFSELRGAPLMLQWVICVTLLVALPAAAYRFIEHPAILFGKRLVSRAQAVHVHLTLGRDVDATADNGGNRETGREAGAVAL